MTGRIELITGPMFSGKTKELLMRRKAYNQPGISHPMIIVPQLIAECGVASIVFSEDVRIFQTHDEHLYYGLVCSPEELPTKIGELCGPPKPPATLCIDEVQFFPPEVIPVIERAAKEWGWTVICAGLDRDFAGERWETTKKLVDIADCVIRLRARCAICGNLAERTQRRHLDGTPARVDEPRIVINNGLVTYEPRCWRCHLIDNGK